MITPHEAEKAVIWLSMQDSSLVESSGLHHGDFSALHHKAVWSSIEVLVAEGRDLDPVSVMDHVKADTTNPLGYAEFSEITNTFAEADRFEQYVADIRTHNQTKQLVHMLSSFSSRAASGESASLLIPGLMSTLSELLENEFKSEQSVRIEDVAKNLIEKAILISSGEAEDDKSISTGYRDIDSTVGGLHRGKLVVIAGRPSMGKSALARSIGLRASLRDQRVLLVTPEDTRETATARCLSEVSGVSLFKIMRNTLSEEDGNRLKWALDDFNGMEFVVDDTGGISVDAIASRCAAVRPDILIVDYIQLVTAGRKDRQEEVNQVVRSLVSLSRRHGIACVAVSQLSRQCEYREDKRPQLSDLRESGEIEQAADCVMFCYRDFYYNKDADPHCGSVIIGKNKNGPTETIDLEWDPLTASFR